MKCMSEGDQTINSVLPILNQIDSSVITILSEEKKKNIIKFVLDKSIILILKKKIFAHKISH